MQDQPLQCLLAAFMSLLLVACNDGGGSTTSPSTSSLSLLTGSLGGYGNTDGNGTSAAFNAPASAAVDSGGNVYVADSRNNTIRKVSLTGVVTTIAGNAQSSGSADGLGTAAQFSNPQGVAVDSAGNVYVADTNNNTIRKITTTGQVTTLAGVAGSSGSADGAGAEARFNAPQGLAVDGIGNVYVADMLNHAVRRITAAGVVTTWAGSALHPGNCNGTGTAAQFGSPRSVAVDSAGNVYVADIDNNTICKISPATIVTTLAGYGTGYVNGAAAVAEFNGPTGVTVDSTGNVYVADMDNSAIRKITAAGEVSTLSGGTVGSADGTGASAQFNTPYGLAVDNSGTVYVADKSNNTIRKVSPTGVVSTLAGAAEVSGNSNGIASAAQFNHPDSIAADSTGNVYVAESFDGTIRKVNPEGVTSTLGGTSTLLPFTPSVFGAATGVAVDGSGNVYLADSQANAIFKVAPAGVVSTLAGNGTIGHVDGAGANAEFDGPTGITVDSNGNVYVVDSGVKFGYVLSQIAPDTLNNTIRKITPSGVVSTLAGTPGASGSADGIGAAAQFNNLSGIAVDSNGNVFVAEGGYSTTSAGVFSTQDGNNTIRKITPSGVVTTLAGLAGSSGSADGVGAAARFNAPQGIAVDRNGNVYVSDNGNSTIRKITTNGVVTTIVGVAGQVGFHAGTLPGIIANPYGLAFLPNGSLVFSSNNAILTASGF